MRRAWSYNTLRMQALDMFANCLTHRANGICGASEGVIPSRSSSRLYSMFFEAVNWHSLLYNDSVVYSKLEESCNDFMQVLVDCARVRSAYSSLATVACSQLQVCSENIQKSAPSAPTSRRSVDCGAIALNTTSNTVVYHGLTINVQNRQDLPTGDDDYHIDFHQARISGAKGASAVADYESLVHLPLHR